MVGIVVHSAAIQDRDGAVPTLQSIRRFYPFLRHIFADGGYAGPKLKQALKGKGGWTIEVIRRCDDTKGFKLLPRRWVVERTFAWLGRCRRLAKDWETSIESSTAWALRSTEKGKEGRKAEHHTQEGATQVLAPPRGNGRDNKAELLEIPAFLRRG